jgi:hypothetical protein
VLALDALALGVQDQHALDQIAQLAHVAGPVVLAQRVERVGIISTWGRPYCCAELLQEFLDQQRNVFLAVAQRRHEERDHVEAVEEVFAEVAAGDLLFEVLVGGGDDAHVDVDGMDRADGEKRCSSSARSTLAWVFRLMSPTSSRKSVPPSARSKVPRFSAGAPAPGRRAGAAAIAEELGLDVVLGDGGAVELDEDAVLAQALGVHGAADQLLAGAGFAVDQHAAVGRRHQLDLLAQRLHGHAVAGDAARKLSWRTNSWLSSRSWRALMAFFSTIRVRSSESGFSRKS